MEVCLNGNFVEKNDAKISISDHGFLYGDGVYETLRTYNKKPWLIDEHLKRFRQSIDTVGIEFMWTNDEVVNLVIALLKRCEPGEYRIRLTANSTPNFLIEAVPLVLPDKKNYENGVSAITFDGERPFPLVKSISMVTSMIAKKEILRAKVFEAFLLDRNKNITEGSISNIFAIKDGIIYTPKERILEGTVRNLMIELLKNEFEMRVTSIAKKDIYDFDEVFLTSSIKGIVPVVKIDGKKIGDGKVGEITKRAMKILKENLINYGE